MRYVDRKSIVPPPSLTAAGGAGKTELANATAHYATPGAGTYEFTAYKNEDVLQALRDLFKKKCAYCESNFEAVSPADIEHYRPKGGVKDDKRHGGYWWLAGSWDNLLPSCIECNRERYQHVASEGMTQRDLDAIKRILSGKKNAFPIAGTRARRPGDDHDAEDPLLIDPTRRDPDRHLSWEELNYSGHASALSVVSPKRDDGKPDQYGDESIAIYGLNRRGLVERRTALLLGLKTEATRLTKLVNFASRQSGDDLKELLAIIEPDFVNFIAKTNDECEYSRCAKAYIDTASMEILAHVKALKAKL